MKRLLSTVLLASICAHAAPLPEAAPESQGLAGERVRRLDDHFAASVARGEYLGAVVLVMRNGRIVDFRAWGHRDLGRQSPLARDAIFRIDTLTRAVTAAAVLTLLEEGRLDLDDPVARYLPEFAGAAPRLTIRQLLAQTAGFAPPARLAAAQVMDAPDLAEFTRRLATVPLAFEPGTRFADDGICAAVAGRVAEVVSGLRFDAFLHKRLFLPLGMRDTAFVVPPAQRHRIVDVATTDEHGKLAPPVETDAAPGQRRHPYLSGADGLYSTAEDFARFAQMLLNGGALDGVRVLGRKSIELMMQNHLSLLPDPTWDGRHAEGYGLGGAVLLDVARRARLGSAGTFGWAGGLSAEFAVDPRERMVLLMMVQHVPSAAAPAAGTDFHNLVYQALAR
ncbi:CubicO group peptidase (beta-lactamase class C family) [Pseudoduganella flava]|nr:serine hydrolase domain-containing protein [Pseudoduganella flava]TWI45525.1 CubicO group peptidase (beta-lactamase class C family) [Pseudoduganella flava]